MISANDFVHVFEEFSLDAVFDEVNTITDFLAYLEKRESFLTQDSLPVLAAGEEHLLSIYLTKMNQDDEHDFVVPCAPEGGSSDHVYIDVGFWEEMQQNPLYKSKKDADQISYLWDELIERFIKLGTPNRGGNPDFEPGLRLMASESRVRRRELASAFYGVVARGVSMARVSYSDAFTDRGYVFLALAVPEDSSYEEYREFRRNMLHAYCLVAKLRCHNAQHMIGIATEPSSSHGSSEDLLVLDVSDWTPARRREAKQLQSEFGLLEDKRVVTRRGTTMEYPEPLQNDVERQRADSPLVSRSKAKQKRKKRTARASRRRNRR